MTRRLYLDTGDLNAIADGRVERTVIEELRTAMTTSSARLVISRSHMQDALSQTDAQTKERFVSTIESFQPVLMVMSGPSEVEPLRDDRTDIELQLCTNFREVVFSPAAAPWLADANTTQDEMHVGNVSARAVRLAAPEQPRRVSNAALGLFVQCAVTLIRGWMGDDIEAIVTRWEVEGPHRVTPTEREAVLVGLIALHALMTPLQGTIQRDDLDVTELLRRIGAIGTAPAQYPGQHLIMVVGGAMQRDTRRRRQRSDWVDLDHIAHFPYVDIATCDAGTFHAVSGALPRVQGPRTVRVIRNGNLNEVAAALRSAT